MDLLELNFFEKKLKFIKVRCSKSFHKAKYYYEKGVLCLLTVEDLKNLWDRDSASNLKRPCIDRIDPNGNYELSNCRYIELAENTSRKGAYIKRKVFQFCTYSSCKEKPEPNRYQCKKHLDYFRLKNNQRNEKNRISKRGF